MYILAVNGSPRRRGNTTLLVQELLRGAQEAGAAAEELIAEDLQLKYCKGCLRCNVLKRCSISGDDWEALTRKIVQADVLVFASPIYFHHVTASLKKVIDRFRSFINVQITEDGLKHTPWQQWKKQFVLLLCLGSPVADDAQPVIDLFSFLKNELGPANILTSIVGTRLAVVNQVKMKREQLEVLYNKLQLPVRLVERDYLRNQALLKKCYTLGKNLGAGKIVQ
jgi:NAD(P)H-dependent FMN reductase